MDDTAIEPDELLKVILYSPDGADITSGSGTITIQNDDTGVAVGDAAVLEGQSGTSSVAMTVNLSSPRVVPRLRRLSDG